MNLLDAAKAALDALETCDWDDNEFPDDSQHFDRFAVSEAATRLRAAIEEAERAVPVANAEFCPHCNPCRNGERIGKSEKLNEEYDFVLRGIASYLGVGGYNETNFRLIDPKVADKKIRWGIDNLHLPAPTVSEWQPIETAPKDGAQILLTRKSLVADGFWEKRAYGGNGCWVWPYIHKEPTHWMPLPSAPKPEDV